MLTAGCLIVRRKRRTRTAGAHQIVLLWIANHGLRIRRRYPSPPSSPGSNPQECHSSSCACAAQNQRSHRSQRTEAFSLHGSSRRETASQEGCVLAPAGSGAGCAFIAAPPMRPIVLLRLLRSSPTYAIRARRIESQALALFSKWPGYSVMIRSAHSTSETKIAGLPNFAPH